MKVTHSYSLSIRNTTDDEMCHTAVITQMTEVMHDVGPICPHEVHICAYVSSNKL